MTCNDTVEAKDIMAASINYYACPMDWVGDLAGRRAMITPSRIALYDTASRQRHTFAEMNERANRVGVYLADALGLKKGDKVCVISRSRIELVDLYLACGKLGLILSPLSYRLQKTELDELLGRIQPQVLIYEAVFAQVAEALDVPASIRQTMSLGDPPDVYRQEVLTCTAREVNVALTVDDPFLYVHTGGTTATPKICVISHRQMMWNAFEIFATGAAMADPGGKEVLVFPLFHIGGWNVLNYVFYSGGQSILMREFDPGLFLTLIEQEKLKHIGGVEAMFQRLQAHPEFQRTDFSSVRSITAAGAPCSEDVMRPFWAMGIPVTQAYGSTEAGPSNFSYIPKSDRLEETITHADKIGTPMFHCDYRIVDQQTRQPVGNAEVGELCLRSLHTFDGYLDEPQRTAQAIDQDGWYFSGDLAVADAEGLVRIVGRVDDMFITGGENVSPQEIEQTLQRHPAVAGAICTGIRDRTWGQVPVALVVLHENQAVTPQEIIVFCRQQMAHYKVPKAIRIGEALPLTGAGKLDRNALKAMFQTVDYSGI